MTTNITESQVTKHSSDNDIVLSVQGVSKKFCRSLKRSLFYGVQDIASELAGVRKNNNQLRKEEFWALKDVSFELKKGESLGLVGPNGSGKTTLLRIISCLIKPDTGSVKITGRVAPLIALGAGFNPILTGRENIYVNMSILGLSKEEIDDRFDEVVDFAEIGDAIDAPVQTYSSGMRARLGFACAIHTEPDILLIDEVLAVGDIKFRAKCHRKLSELRKKNKSFIMVSHQTQAILNVCETSVYLSRGNVLQIGNTDYVIRQYEKDLFNQKLETSLGKIILPTKNKEESFGLDILSISFKDKTDNYLSSIKQGEEAYFCIECNLYKDINNICLIIPVRELNGENNLVLFLNNFTNQASFNLSSGKHEIKMWIPQLILKPGLYDMRVVIRHGTLHTLDAVESFRFQVDASKHQTNQVYYQPHIWESQKI